MPKVTVRTICKPTEKSEKVIKSMLNIFPDLQIRQVGEIIEGVGESVDTLGELLKVQRIRSAARAVFKKSIKESRLVFRLSKQVAFVGKVNFAERSPLGDLEVIIDDENLDALIDRIAPRLPEV